MRAPKVGIAALTVAVALGLAACGSDDETPAPVSTTAAAGEPTTFEIAPPTGAPAGVAGFTVTQGKKTAGPDTVEVERGTTVRLALVSDQADEIHVHGYDKTLEVAPLAPATLEFVADIPGVFEVELHKAGTLLTQLRVN